MRRNAKRPRTVDPNDQRDAMQRLLEDGQDKDSGYVWVLYSAQWPTLFRAQRLGYLDESNYLTAKGREYLATKARTI